MQSIRLSPDKTYNINLTDLYQCLVTQLSSMVAPFSEGEIKEAFLQMNPQASPCHDSFELAFYQKFWSILKPIILPLLSCLTYFICRHKQNARSKAHIVLLPKKDSTVMPDFYRPISLQNSLIKVVAEVLHNLLKP